MARCPFAGEQGGYGNVVVLQHSGTYSTVYAHLSRFARRSVPEARVRQGDTIGYVGQTGWATGPHLHYEFRVDGEARNPVDVAALPIAQPVTPAARAGFDAAVAALARELARRPHAFNASGSRRQTNARSTLSPESR